MAFRKIPKLPFNRDYFMALFFGAEVGLATTSAIATGLLMSTSDKNIVLATATISFIVQALNNAVSRFSTEHTNDEIDNEDALKGYREPAMTALLQFITHIIMGTLVLLPIIKMNDITTAMLISVGITLALLFVLGFYKGRIVGLQALSDGLEQLGLGILVISVGALAGFFLTR